MSALRQNESVHGKRRVDDMENKDDKKKGIGSMFEAFAFIPQMSLSFVIPIFLGAMAGNWVDDKLGSEPVFFVLLLLLGTCGGTVTVYRLFQRISKK